MSRETLQLAVELAGGQTALADGIRARMPGSKVGQVHVWGWLHSVKFEVPPPETVLPIADFLNYRITPHDLRPDLYPHPMDGLPASMRAGCDCKGEAADPAVRARAGCERRDHDRRDDDPSFGEFGEARTADRRQEDRRSGDCENEAAT